MQFGSHNAAAQDLEALARLTTRYRFGHLTARRVMGADKEAPRLHVDHYEVIPD
jgi:hypothetical protein